MGGGNQRGHRYKIGKVMYALVDCNNFYVSCERVFNPGLRDKPVIVLSNNDGCAISRSEEAKALGVEMGAVPHLMPPELRRQVQMFSSNYTLYGDMSDRVMSTLATFVPQMEIYSIDEAFLDMNELKYQDLQKLGITIRRTVLKNIGIPVCVGIAPTKALAKMANRFAKKQRKLLGVHSACTEQQVHEMLDWCPVNDVWGIGRQYAAMLQKNGIRTALQFAQAPDDFVRAKMSVVGLRLQKELNGIPCIEWEFEPPAKKGICTGRSFGKLLTEKKDIAEALSNYAAVCAHKLRQQHSVAKVLRVFINTNPHRADDPQYFRSIALQFAVPSADTPVVIKYALKALDMIFKEGHKFMKCGVELVNLVPNDQVQMSLFAPAGDPRRKKAVATMDKLNNQLGKDLVRFGIQGFERSYKARAAHLSPCYTTRLDDIIKTKN